VPGSDLNYAIQSRSPVLINRYSIRTGTFTKEVMLTIKKERKKQKQERKKERKERRKE
jgi:hypothetical protein